MSPMLTNVTDPDIWKNLTTEAWCNYNNDPAIGAEYGKLYNWWAIEKIDAAYNPLGWRVSTQSDFDTLITALGGASVAGGKMKENGLTHWNTPNTDASNISGFTGLGAGYRSYNSGWFISIKAHSYFYSSQQATSTTAWSYQISYNTAICQKAGSNSKKYGFSTRLIKI